MGSTSFFGFSCPNLLLVFLNLLFLGTCIIFFSQVLGVSLGLFYFILFFCTLIGLACDHGNSFLCLEEKKDKVLYWIEVRTVFNVKTTKRIGSIQVFKTIYHDTRSVLLLTPDLYFKITTSRLCIPFRVIIVKLVG